MLTVKVGDKFKIERRGVAGHLAHTRIDTVTKMTGKRAYIGQEWFALDDPKRVLKPKYCDYLTTATPITGE